MAVQVVGARVRLVSGVARSVIPFAFDRAGDTPSAERAREDVGHAGEHGFGGEVGPPIVDHGEHERRCALGSDVARDLQRGRIARQVQQHGDVAALQLGEREGEVVRPDDRDVGVAEQLLGVGTLAGGAAEIQDRCHRRARAVCGASTGVKWPSPARSTSSRALPSTP